MTPSLSVPSGAARSRRNVGQPDDALAHEIAGYKAERRPRAGEERLAAAEHDGMEVESILIDKAKRGAGNGDRAGKPGLQVTNHRLDVIRDQRGVGADRLQRA